ncbi:hypothetical protein COCNU_08G006270 [Cocos nucifera]|uniref:Uncharacterized protein n=1 Tax=Cocos nucifera TaxID=13894 RepID=A0A8K0IJ80_COCNU|nr:hypothetical protein COCNU_08G006270 [Cocos nucifera]
MIYRECRIKIVRKRWARKHSGEHSLQHLARYLEAKRKKQKKAKTHDVPDFPGHEEIKFGEIVGAPPKLSLPEDKSGSLWEERREAKGAGARTASFLIKKTVLDKSGSLWEERREAKGAGARTASFLIKKTVLHSLQHLSRYLEAKRKKQKKAKTHDVPDFPGHEEIKFGEIVGAPPKLSLPEHSLQHLSRYLEAKRKKQKKAKTHDVPDFPGHEEIKFGEIVGAPPKLSLPEVSIPSEFCVLVNNFLQN